MALLQQCWAVQLSHSCGAAENRQRRVKHRVSLQEDPDNRSAEWGGFSWRTDWAGWVWASDRLCAAPVCAQVSGSWLFKKSQYIYPVTLEFKYTTLAGFVSLFWTLCTSFFSHFFTGNSKNLFQRSWRSTEKNQNFNLILYICLCQKASPICLITDGEISTIWSHWSELKVLV